MAPPAEEKEEDNVVEEEEKEKMPQTTDKDEEKEAEMMPQTTDKVDEEEEEMMPQTTDEVEEEEEEEETIPQTTDKVEEEEEEQEEETIPQTTDKVEEEEEKKEETIPQTTGKIEKKTPSPEPPKEEKEEVLNLNNEVVRMRKEVKRVRTLVLRKLMRQISALKKKKGNETEMERNRNRAARLVEEIHVMKTLLPDVVTKTALVQNLDFNQVCRNPKSTMSDRAIARIANHSQFSKKIAAIRAAVKAFKDSRMKGGKQGKAKKQTGKVTPESKDSNPRTGGREGKDKEEQGGAAVVEQKEVMDNVERDCNLKDSEKKQTTVDESSEKDEEKATPSAQPTDLPNKETPQTPEAKSVRTATSATSTGNTEMNLVKNAPQRKAAKNKPNLKPAPKAHQKKEGDEEEESDLEPSGDEEKEYFDDSTEERFLKQSSQSEESDADDFFLGKVSRFKKKKSVDGEKTKNEKEEGKLDERQNSEVTKVQTVFCSTLSSSKQGRGGRGKGGNEFRGRGRQRGGGPDGSSKFQKQNRQPEGKPGFNNSKYESEGKGVAFAGRGQGRGQGRGRGRGDFARQQDRRGAGVFSHQAPQQALHPSWEASKKRKEQQGQILAFQGKKIKFDDDD
ncbi:serum response factor-binding protein 1 [Diretmus argenteus]